MFGNIFADGFHGIGTHLLALGHPYAQYGHVLVPGVGREHTPTGQMLAHAEKAVEAVLFTTLTDVKQRQVALGGQRDPKRMGKRTPLLRLKSVVWNSVVMGERYMGSVQFAGMYDTLHRQRQPTVLADARQ